MFASWVVCRVRMGLVHAGGLYTQVWVGQLLRLLTNLVTHCWRTDRCYDCRAVTARTGSW